MGLVVDPVCGMEFAERDAAARAVFQNQTYYFCHPVCKRIFDAEPTYFVESQNVQRARPSAADEDPTASSRNLKPDCEWLDSTRAT